MRLALTPLANDWFREFDSFFDTANVPVKAGTKQDTWLPAVDVDETEKNYLFSLDMPGIPKDSIKIEFHDGKLHISGERNLETEKKEGTKRIVERQRGKFERTFLLGNDVDADKVEASYKDGVLSVTVPKSEIRKSKVIQIKDVH